MTTQKTGHMHGRDIFAGNSYVADAKANAEFIVAAVNSHEDLKQILAQFLDGEPRMFVGRGSACSRDALLTQARNLLKTL